jgi:DNA replication and repair protein RecF
MRARRVSTLGFRNLTPADVALSDGLTLVWGANGAGKTNLLEALYLGLAGRSPRTKADRETVAFGEPLARVEVEVWDEDPAGGPRTFRCAIERAGERRHQVDGRTVDPAADAELRPALSVFMPDRLVLVKGPPAARRAHLDRFCAALWPPRAEARRRYGRALAQRNALLGRIRGGAAAEGSLDAWDAELSGAGAELIEIRAAAAAELAPPFAAAAAALGLAGESALAYRPRSEASSAEELAGELAERRRADLDRGFTTHGPHLDELALRRGGRALRRYGSQGEQRLALLALLFAEREVLVDEGRPPPLMLLDDVTSELDPDRRTHLCDRLVAGGGQALITATEPGQLPAECPREELGMREGRVIAAAGGVSRSGGEAGAAARDAAAGAAGSNAAAGAAGSEAA